MKQLALKISFDGTDFWGWQKTGSGKSVEEALERILEKIFSHPIHIEAASRLDRGVHAHEQIASFVTFKELDLTDLFRQLNALLPSSIRILDCVRVPFSFHPSLDVEKKVYRYVLNTSQVPSPFARFTSWHIPHLLCVPAMEKGAERLKGKRDFQAFCNQRKGLNYKNYERDLLDIRIEYGDKNFLEIFVVGNHFLYKMVRNIVGLLVGYGRGLSLPSPEEILDKKDRALSYVTAPAHGLSLYRIHYPDQKNPFILKMHENPSL